MKKSALVFLIIFSFLAGFLFIPSKSFAQNDISKCEIISNKNPGENEVQLSPSGTLVKASSGRLKATVEVENVSSAGVVISLPIKFTPECINAITYKASLAQGGKYVESETLTVTSAIHTITGVIGPELCKPSSAPGYQAAWQCDNIMLRGLQTVNGVNNWKTLVETVPLDLTILLDSDEIIAAFKKIVPSASFDGKNLPPGNTEDCSVNSVTVTSNNGSNVFTANADGVLPKDHYYEAIIHTNNDCLTKTIALYVYMKGVGGENTGKDLELFENKIKIIKPDHYIDFTPPFDKTYCLESVEAEYRVYNCSLAVFAKSTTGNILKQGDFYPYKVRIPINKELDKIPAVIIRSDVPGTDLGSFGSTTIKEGFSWDPCYDPETQKMVTYLDLKNPKQTQIKDLKPEQIAAGKDECYTLLSGLPIKFNATDPVSDQVGYLEARDKNGKVIPGIFKTVIVGRFYIGHFVTYLFKLFMGIFGLISVAVLIYIGIAIASNRDNSEKLKVLKEWLSRVFIAIAILLGSYLILSIIDPKLTDVDFGITNFNLSEQGFPDIEFNTSFDPVTGKKQTIAFADAYKIAKEAEGITKIPAAFIMATLQQESALGGNIGKCNVAGTPNWQTIMGNSTNGQADQKAYIEIMDNILHRKKENQPLSCPSGGGRGGAMGPLQFIPTTWLSVTKAASKLGISITDPWDMRQAIFGASILYMLNGANTSYDSLRDAACKYYSGSPCTPGRNPPNEFYGDAVVKKAKQAEADIKLMLESQNK
ncbi:MAG TPA: lytic murein transglycosylase [Candidatus Paceibacterota bacterium]